MFKNSKKDSESCFKRTIKPYGDYKWKTPLSIKDFFRDKKYKHEGHYNKTSQTNKMLKPSY